MASRRRTGSRHEFPDKDRSSLGSRFRQMNRPPENTSWCWLTADMLASPAWRALTGNAMKVVLRIALEHLKHGGVENGKLPVTYQDFARWGVRKNSVREAQLVATHLGWIERTSTGEVPWHGDIRRPSTFGLTWLPRYDGAPASNRWTRFETDLEAKAAIRHAKAELAQLRRMPSFFNRQVNQSPTPKDATWMGDDSDTSSSNDQVRERSSDAETSGNDCGTPFYISGYPGPDASPTTSNSARANDATTVSPRARPEDDETLGLLKAGQGAGDPPAQPRRGK